MHEHQVFLASLVGDLHTVALCIVQDGVKVRSNKCTKIIQERSELVLGLKRLCVRLVTCLREMNMALHTYFFVPCRAQQPSAVFAYP